MSSPSSDSYGRRFASAPVMAVLLLGAAACAWGNGAEPAAELKDPTRPLRGPFAQDAAKPQPQAQQAPRLESVLIGAGRRVAVIDGRRMTEGEEHRGVKVWRIDPHSVVVSVNGSSPMALVMGESEIHKEWR